ncbi:hypothetical protein QR680_015460 [Steinernema hermaphroditum]|uniref:TIL domain-containing protein n=1 Tax=Steinernema hermaphroditum TaxID=289476 RepID=A0AA39LKR1_9BILA|nr:hypothetical protein QR680_015460 [Steinernema hermaphroditum]
MLLIILLICTVGTMADDPMIRLPPAPLHPHTPTPTPRALQAGPGTHTTPPNCPTQTPPTPTPFPNCIEHPCPPGYVCLHGIYCQRINLECPPPCPEGYICDLGRCIKISPCPGCPPIPRP